MNQPYKISQPLPVAPMPSRVGILNRALNSEFVQRQKAKAIELIDDSIEATKNGLAKAYMGSKQAIAMKWPVLYMGTAWSAEQTKKAGLGVWNGAKFVYDESRDIWNDEVFFPEKGKRTFASVSGYLFKKPLGLISASVRTDLFNDTTLAAIKTQNAYGNKWNELTQEQKNATLLQAELKALGPPPVRKVENIAAYVAKPFITAPLILGVGGAIIGAVALPAFLSAITSGAVIGAFAPSLLTAVPGITSATMTGGIMGTAITGAGLGGVLGLGVSQFTSLFQIGNRMANKPQMAIQLRANENYQKKYKAWDKKRDAILKKYPISREPEIAQVLADKAQRLKEAMALEAQQELAEFKDSTKLNYTGRLLNSSMSDIAQNVKLGDTAGTEDGVSSPIAKADRVSARRALMGLDKPKKMEVAQEEIQIPELSVSPGQQRATIQQRASVGSISGAPRDANGELLNGVPGLIPALPVVGGNGRKPGT